MAYSPRGPATECGGGDGGGLGDERQHAETTVSTAAVRATAVISLHLRTQRSATTGASGGRAATVPSRRRCCAFRPPSPARRVDRPPPGPRQSRARLAL